MATELTESPDAPERVDGFPPYPASVVDRFLAWVDRLHLPAWFFYLALLLIYDEAILGETHPVVYGLFFANTTWALYLINRLLRFWRVATAIRYAIPTAIIAWNCVELLGRWNFFKEIWVHPMDYALEMGLIFGAVVIAVVLSYMTPARGKAEFTNPGTT